MSNDKRKLSLDVRLSENLASRLAYLEDSYWLKTIAVREQLKEIDDLSRLSSLDSILKANLSQLEYKPPWIDIVVKEQERLQASMLKTLEPMNSMYASLAEQFKTLNPMLEMLNKIHEQTRPFQIALNYFEDIQKQWSFATENILGGLSKTIQELVPPEYFIKMRLQSQGWLITESAVLDKINELKPAYEEMGQVIVGHFKENDWERMTAKVESWKPHVSERFEHFKSYIYMTKEIKTGESHKATIPAIIAQLDGLVRELRTLLPSEIKIRIQQEIIANLPEELKGKKVDTRNEVIVHVVAEVVDFWSANMLQEVIFGGLFRDSKDISSDEGYLLFRHKILHGDPEYLSYGTEENFVRLMLYADFLVHLIAYFKNKRPLLDSSTGSDS